MERVMAVVGHELRTPLAALRATSEFLLSDSAEEDVRKTFLASIHDEVIRMAELVNNVLEAARINSGTVRWNWGKVDLVQTVDNAFSIIGSLIDQQAVTLAADIPEGLAMRGDREAIQRLIINFVSNSAKHTSDGAIRVCASEFTDDERRRWVELQIRDSGGGIANETLEKLGKAFVLNSGVVGSDYIKGTGLGLAICGGIVAAHGGTISVASKQGEGTTFTVRLRADLEGADIQSPDDIEIQRTAA